MRNDIQLWLNGKRADLESKESSVKLNYSTIEYSNPTVVKNSFSKSLVLKGTPTNDRIFDSIFDLNRTQDFELFNPCQRTDFQLFNNGELVEQGYFRLDSISRSVTNTEYKLTLFGGLGNFLFNLSYNEEQDREMRLSDINFMGSTDPDGEFTFEIRKERVYDAWTRCGQSGNTGSWRKWDYINFCPTYDGTSLDGFDTESVLFNTNGMNGVAVRYTSDSGIHSGTFPMSISDGEAVYGTNNGFLKGALRQPLDAYEVRDLRSYLMRPCLNVKKTIEALCNENTNGGYTVRLDPEFFNDSNPYWSKAWMTLPLLDNSKDAVDEFEDWHWSKVDEMSFHQTGLNAKKTCVKWKMNTQPLDTTPSKYTMKVEIHTTITGATGDRVYTSAMCNNGYDPEEEYPNPQLFYWGAVVLQMYGFSNGGTWYNQPAKCGSNLLCLTSRGQNGAYIGQQTINTWFERAYPDTEIVYNFGYWKRVSGNDFVWHNVTDNTDLVTINMDTDLLSMIPNIGLQWGFLLVQSGALVDAKRGFGFDSQYYPFYDDINWCKYDDDISLDDQGSTLLYRLTGRIKSFRTITKADLLSGLEMTPAQFLLSFCKLFGLMIHKDPVDPIIYIDLRKNFYTGGTMDLSDRVDIGKLDIKPLTFDSKWYRLAYSEAESEFIDSYLDSYGHDYGSQLIDTQYNFDSETVDLLEDFAFRNGITVLEKSNYYNTKKDLKGFQIPQALFDWVEVSYYDNEGNTYETNMALPQDTTIEFINPLTPNEFYDAVPKLQCHTKDGSTSDGSCELVFFNGLVATDADYWISDDIPEMFVDGDEPCWLQTMQEYDSQWNRIAIHIYFLPSFDRYITHNLNVPMSGHMGVIKEISASFDIGRVKELYVPYYRYNPDKMATTTVYENFHRSLYRDLYDISTRIVDTRIVFPQGRPQDALRRFYWFDGCVWVMNKISDYDISSDGLVSCSFTKVQDINDYLELPTYDDYKFAFRRTDGTNEIPYSGTTDELTVWFAVDCSNDWQVQMSNHNMGYFGNHSGFYAGHSGENISISYTFFPNNTNNPRSNTFYCINMDNNETIEITVTQQCYVPQSVLFVNPTELSVPRETNGQVFSTLLYTTAPWTSTCDEAWVHPQQSSGIAGFEQPWYFTCDLNTEKVTRKAEVRFSNGIDQCSFVILQSGESVGKIEQENSGRFAVAAEGGTVSYLVECDDDWVVDAVGVSSAYTSCPDYGVTHSATSGYEVSITIAPNQSNASRNIVFAMETDGRYIQPVREPLPLTQDAAGETIINATSAITETYYDNAVSMPWTAVTYDNWITLAEESGTSAETMNTIKLDENTGSTRIGSVYITYTDSYGYPCYETVSVVQAGEDVTFDVYPTYMEVAATSGTYIVNVTASTMYTATTSDSWIGLNAIDSVNIKTFTVSANTGRASRTGTITFSDGNDTIDVTVVQMGG